MLYCLFMFYLVSGVNQYLHVLTHPFPTRRSSDLRVARHFRSGSGADSAAHCAAAAGSAPGKRDIDVSDLAGGVAGLARRACCHRLAARSEKHTSELQSLMRLSYAVFSLTKKQQPDLDTDS